MGQVSIESDVVVDQDSSDNGHATDWHLVHIGVRTKQYYCSRRWSPTDTQPSSRFDGRPRRGAVGLCDVRRGGHCRGSDRGRSRGLHLAQGRRALDGLADRAARASRRLCAHVGRESRHSARACGPQGVYPRAVGTEKRGSHTSRGHVDCVCQRKWMARQRYLFFFFSFRFHPSVMMNLFHTDWFIIAYSVRADRCTVGEGLPDAQGDDQRRFAVVAVRPRRIRGSDKVICLDRMSAPVLLCVKTR